MKKNSQNILVIVLVLAFVAVFFMIYTNKSHKEVVQQAPNMKTNTANASRISE